MRLIEGLSYLMYDYGWQVSFEIQDSELIVSSNKDALKIPYTLFAVGKKELVKNQYGTKIWIAFEVEWQNYLDHNCIEPLETLIDGSKLYRLHTHCTHEDLREQYNNYVYFLNGKQVGVCGRSMWASDQHVITRYESALIPRLNKEIAQLMGVAQ
jgi:hypothetical protein